MPRKIRPSSWTPAGFSGTVDPISKRDRAKIEAALGKTISDERLREIEIALGELLGDRQIDAGRPTRKEVLAGLETVLKNATSLKDSLFKLDAIGDEALTKWFADQNGVTYLETQKEFKRFESHLKKLIRATRAAIKDINSAAPNHQQFRPKPNQPLYNCIAKLGKIYKSETGKAPTTYYSAEYERKGSFFSFVQTCIDSLWETDEIYSNEISLAKSIKIALKKKRKN